jgi:hypothetical protein
MHVFATSNCPSFRGRLTTHLKGLFTSNRHRMAGFQTPSDNSDMVDPEVGNPVSSNLQLGRLTSTLL